MEENGSPLRVMVEDEDKVRVRRSKLLQLMGSHCLGARDQLNRFHPAIPCSRSALWPLSPRTNNPPAKAACTKRQH